MTDVGEIGVEIDFGEIVVILVSNDPREVVVSFNTKDQSVKIILKSIT